MSAAASRVLLLLLLLAGSCCGTWPSGHINSLTDVRCRQWCTFKFKESCHDFFGDNAAMHEFTVKPYVEKAQDSLRPRLQEMKEQNVHDFFEFSRGLPVAERSSHPRLKFFNSFHTYLDCLLRCFES